jgi:plastocyanin
MRFRSTSAFGSMALSAVLGIACGGGGGGGGGGGNTPTLAIAKTAGDNQTGTVATALAVTLQVTVTEDGTAKAGVLVDWTSTATGASFAPAQSSTDPSGVAQTVWTLGTAAGVQTARATIAGTTRSVTFMATASPGAPSAFTKAGGDNQSQQVNAAFGTPLSAKVADQFGNGIAGITVNWNVISGPVTLTGGGGSAQSTTNAQGIATMGVTAGGTAGAAQVDATTGAVSGTLSYNLTVTPVPVTVTVGPGIVFSSDRNGSQNPAVDTVAVGGAVRWTWTGSLPHSVASQGVPSFTSSGVFTGAPNTYTVTFQSAGTYQYDCGVHGTLMTGTIVVQ